MADRACVFLLRDAAVLMVRQTYRGITFWTFPGGGLHPGEQPAAAARREVAEETGLEVRIVRPLLTAPRASSPGTYHCFLGEVGGGSLHLGVDLTPDGRPELHGVRWLPVSSVRDLPEVARVLGGLGGPP